MRCSALVLLIACTPAQDPPVLGDAPTGDALAGDAPTGDALVGDAPTGDVFADGDGLGDARGDGDAPTEIQATPGFCPVDQRAGLIGLQHAWGTLNLSGAVYEGVPTHLGPPVLSEPPCAHYYPSSCAPVKCTAEQVCNYAGECVAPVLSREDLVVSVNGDMFVYDPQWASVHATLVEAAEYVIEVILPDQPVIRFSAALPGMFSEPPTAVDAGMYSNTGSLTTTWTSTGEGASMQVYCRPNHHVPVGFTQCLVDDDVETATASAAMIDPLRIGTGFEGGYFLRQFVGSAEMDFGCVEISLGVHELMMLGN